MDNLFDLIGLFLFLKLDSRFHGNDKQEDGNSKSFLLSFS